MGYTRHQRNAFALLVALNAAVLVWLVAVRHADDRVVLVYAVVLPVLLRMLLLAGEELNPRLLLQGLQVRRALARGEIVFHYQPKVSALNGQPVSVEALARWDHPSRGLLLPAAWLGTLELPWLERRFVRYTLDVVCRQAAQWHARGWDLAVCVNIGPRAFSQPDLPAAIGAALERCSLPPTAIMIELTEQALDFSPLTREVAEELAARGIALALDDFGIGHSAMDRVVRLPIRELKIDRRFVSNLPGNAREAAVVASAVGLCHNLGIASVAEGVESKACLETLRRHGCDQVQGYYVSRPLPAAELEAWLGTPEARGHLVPAAPTEFERRSRLRREEDRLIRQRGR